MWVLNKGKINLIYRVQTKWLTLKWNCSYDLKCWRKFFEFWIIISMYIWEQGGAGGWNDLPKIIQVFWIEPAPLIVQNRVSFGKTCNWLESSGMASFYFFIFYQSEVLYANKLSRQLWDFFSSVAVKVCKAITFSLDLGSRLVSSLIKLFYVSKMQITL